MKKQLRIVGCFIIIFAIMMLTACKGNAPVDFNNTNNDSNISYGGTDIMSDDNSSNTSQPESSTTTDVGDAVEENSSSNTASTPNNDGSHNEHTHAWRNKVVAPTCTFKGYTLSTCSCGTTEKGSWADALGHSWGEWTTVKTATQSTAGLERRTCKRCGATEEKTLERLPQTTEDWYREILNLVNTERAKHNLNPLEYYYVGQSAADIRAKEIKDVFSHTRPNDKSCFTVFEELNISYLAAGENIAYGYKSPEAVMQGWMNSEGHRNNILSANFTHIIVGIDGTHWVQLFLKL